MQGNSYVYAPMPTFNALRKTTGRICDYMMKYQMLSEQLLKPFIQQLVIILIESYVIFMYLSKTKEETTFIEVHVLPVQPNNKVIS